MRNKLLLIMVLMAGVALAKDDNANCLNWEEDAATGGLVSIRVVGDETAMNWIRKADAKEFAWIGSNYRWGTGTLKVDGAITEWNHVVETQSAGKVVYRPTAGLEIVRTRKAIGGGIEERYVFRNVSSKSINLSEIDIHTPFRDDYIPMQEMFTSRCHAHIWTGGSSAWVCALRMGGKAPHLGLVVTDGLITAYGQKERARNKRYSNTRGVLTLSPPDVSLAPCRETSVAWRIFSHDGKADFLSKVRRLGGVTIAAADWTVTAKEPVELAFEVDDAQLLENAVVRGEGVAIASVCRNGRRLLVSAAYERDGEARVVLEYAGGRRTWAELLARGDPSALVKARAAFIVRNQVYHSTRPEDPRDGALLEYDNETNQQYHRWEHPKEARLDENHNEGAERVAMGVFLAMMVRNGYTEYRPTIDRYREFLRNGLQEADYTTWGCVTKDTRHRLFNYPWVAEFYLEHYRATGCRQSLLDAYGTMMKAYEKPVNYSFVESPECEIVAVLREAGFKGEADRLLSTIKAHDALVVKSEQGVGNEVSFAPEWLAGRITQTLGLWKLTGDAKYREFTLQKLLPQLEAAMGPQPSWHSHDIGMHHWDGYWFGKRRCWGDTLPHDWNGTGADAFVMLAEATGDARYRVRARAVVRQLLGLFDADGRAGCAWVLPDRVNGEPARFRDPLANDQDWSLVYYIRNGEFAAGLDLAGLWTVEIAGKRSPIMLPGTLADAKLGQRWTREQFETTKDRPQSGALTREYQHLGVATYTREFVVPETYAGRSMELFLERVMWASEVILDGRRIGSGDSLSTAHVYPLGKLSSGRHTLSVSVDNSCRYGFSRNSHSYGPSGQSVWHGIIGRIELRESDPLAAIKIHAASPSGGKVVITGLPADFKGAVTIEGLATKLISREPGRVTLALAEEPVGWSEDTPELYTLIVDGRRFTFGFHTYGTIPHALTVNGVKTFLRANIDNCLFPKLGRPPMAKAEWHEILRVLKEEDGFNAIRFHSWCPPEAAFAAADELGIYLQPEVCIWSDKWMKPAPQHVGWGDPVDDFVRREYRAICDAYGNHPSFMSLAVGNELGGSNWEAAEQLVQSMRAYEPRVLHFFSSARRIVASDQLTATHCIPKVGMCRERLLPKTDWDYEASYSKIALPVLAHEIGQWPTYPDFAALLPKFDGVMRPWNIDRCLTRAQSEGTDRFAREYGVASARMSRLMYKDEVESFLRTPSCAGIHLLDAQDYTGEGEALMGWRDPFFALKPMYRDMKPFRTIWSREAALARLAKYDWGVGETFVAKLQLRNLTRKLLPAGKAYAWSIVAGDETMASGELTLAHDLKPGELANLGSVSWPIMTARREKLELRCGSNAWSFWTFPNEEKATIPVGVMMTEDFTKMRQTLAAGGTVLYTGISRETAKSRFKPVYWSSVWFPSKQPLKEMLGTWLDKHHPMLAGFPTDEAQDWQWYGLVEGARLHRLTGLPREFRPIALAVNDFHYSMLASSLFELKVGKGRLVVCGYDLEQTTPAAKRLRASVFDYLQKPLAGGTVSVPMAWLDKNFAPLGEELLTSTDVIYSAVLNQRGNRIERDIVLSEPATATVELVFDSTAAECSGRGSIDGHAFELPLGKQRRLVRVGIIREDMLDGKLSLRFESAADCEAILKSIRIVR